MEKKRHHRSPTTMPKGEAIKHKKLRIIMDANAFFVPLQFKIDLKNELEELLNRNFELILLSIVKQELTTLARKGSPLERKNAEYALKIAEKCIYIDLKPSTPALVDEIIVSSAKDLKAIVFTNDRQLRKRLRDISVPVIYVRQKSRLQIDGMI
ncbi:TPA: nucleotide-binding protein [Candidatus Bathyarchaeota archaeon]|nr:nucleotide-binding protein [Candidatus Bathyarchaeota archaeon]